MLVLKRTHSEARTTLPKPEASWAFRSGSPPGHALAQQRVGPILISHFGGGAARPLLPLCVARRRGTLGGA